MRSKWDLARRLREVRMKLHGVHGGPELARLPEVPYRTWTNYEQGVTIPGEILLAFVVETGIDPRWLLTGKELRGDQSTGPGEPLPFGRGRLESHNTVIATFARRPPCRGPSSNVWSECLPSSTRCCRAGPGKSGRPSTR